MKNTSFHKRYLKTPKDFFNLIKRNSYYAKKRKTINKKNRISPDFSEKIMLAVTGVNECVYCSYRHTKTALQKGVKYKEINDILKCEFGSFPEEESKALLYAQHWTEKGCIPDTETRSRMIEYYGKQKTEDIEFFMNMVYTGNLISNTVEAYKNHVREKNSFKFFLVYIMCSPIAYFIRQSKRNLKKANVK
jgi:AhpD family alkylhydroperoxidase